MSLDTISCIIRNFKWNIYSVIKSLYIRRDNRIWLFGAWMGEKFADNSRFLFQYLCESKSKYGIKKVIWVANDPNVVNIIRKLGYEAYLTNSKKGIYYHYKSGVHVICNSNKSDIDTKRSFGAIKIQLWHGNGIKASGKFTRKKKYTIKEIIWDDIIKPLLIPGHWYYAHWVACSKESKRVLVNDSGALSKNIIIANSPRLCQCLKYTDDEKQFLEKISCKKEIGYKIVLYLPTFRSDSNNYVAPLTISGFIDYLANNKIIWLQKSHSADSNNMLENLNNENVINLDKNFDVNILYDYIDLLISDYSSATTDAIYKDVVTVDYCPDYDMFRNSDRGFVGKYSNYHIGNFVRNPKDLQRTISYCLERKSDDFPRHKEVKDFLFDNNIADYAIITKSIIQSIGIQSKEK